MIDIRLASAMRGFLPRGALSLTFDVVLKCTTTSCRPLPTRARRECRHLRRAEELRELADNHWLLYAISHRSRCRPCLPRRLPRRWLVGALSRTEHRTGGSRDSRHRLVGPWN